MKMSLRSLFIASLVSLTAICVQAAEVISEAVVLKLSGPVEAVLPGQTKAVAIKIGDKLPQGTAITTSSTGEVELQVFPGTTTTIKAGTKVELEKISLTSSDGVVTKQSSVVSIKVGSVVSSLDPSKKAINDYSIRTPKGVAAARGTVYEVTVSTLGEVRTYVTRGVVVFINPLTNQQVTVQPGFSVTVQPDGTIGEPTPTDVRFTPGQGDDKTKVELIDTTIISPSS